MKFKIVPSTQDGQHQILTTYIINDTLAIDAGAIAIGLSREEQLKLRSIVITHTHLDHIFSLPIFITDLFGEFEKPINIYSTSSDLDALQTHIFNYRVWIPVETLKNDKTELMNFHSFKSGESFITENLKITPIPVTHTVLTHGLLIEDDRSALLFTSDTGATDLIWDVANKCEKLKAVFIDVSFPSYLTDIARISCHHSPHTLNEEARKIREDVQIYAVHLKAAYRNQTEREIKDLNDPRIFVAEVGKEYEF